MRIEQRARRHVLAAAAVVMLYGVAVTGPDSHAGERPVGAPPSTGVAPAQAAAVFEGLVGTWEGEGSLMGRPAVFHMTWSRQLGERFVRLEFHNAFAPENGEGTPQPLIAATAYYQAAGESGQPLRGTWFDTRGYVLPLAATATDTELVSLWGDESTERGRTTYRVLGPDRVEVLDEVERAEGGYGVFGRATYTRVDRH